MGATSTIFEEIENALKNEFVIGTDVDAIERFEDDPTMAVTAHIVDFSGETGASILYGMAIEDPATTDSSGGAMTKALALSFVIVRRLQPGQMIAHGDDLAVSDDLMDRLEDIFDKHGDASGWQQLVQNSAVKNIYLTSRAPVPNPTELDWNAREINFDAIRTK